MDDLARLVAIEAIRQLKARYFRLLDTRDFAAMADVFCADAVFDCTAATQTPAQEGGSAPGPIVSGREAIMDWIAESFAVRTSTHIGHSHEIRIEGPTVATGVVGMMDLIRGPDRATRLVEATGHYHESYRRDEGSWRIAVTRLTRLFRDEVG